VSTQALISSRLFTCPVVTVNIVWLLLAPETWIEFTAAYNWPRKSIRWRMVVLKGNTGKTYFQKYFITKWKWTISFAVSLCPSVRPSIWLSVFLIWYSL